LGRSKKFELDALPPAWNHRRLISFRGRLVGGPCLRREHRRACGDYIDVADADPSDGCLSMHMNFLRFDLVSIRLAVLCAETGSLSAASRLANCSLSAGSQRLSALEDALGIRLFLRDHRGLQITGAGELFIHHANVILEQLEVLKAQLGSLACVGFASAKA
jgi:hypothetical protein